MIVHSAVHGVFRLERGISDSPTENSGLAAPPSERVDGG